MVKTNFFNPELNTSDTYTEVGIQEKVTVRDEKELLVLNHYWRDSNGKLWGDFKNPMENVYRSLDAYRKRKGWMMPNEIRNLREKLGLSIDKLANMLKITPFELIQIETNHRLQTKHEEYLLRSIPNK